MKELAWLLSQQETPMSERNRCQKQGHKWVTAIDGYRLPYWICKRWFCDGHQMSPELANFYEGDIK